MISSSSCARDQGSITRVAGIEVGHYTESRRPTGCSVVLARDGAVAGVDVRGAAPGTRETDLLDPSNLVEQVHAVMLSGGSAWGLEAATGAVRWLEEQGVGLDIGVGRLPLVPSAVLFDLMVGDMRVRPDAAAGYAACAAASGAMRSASRRARSSRSAATPGSSQTASPPPQALRRLSTAARSRIGRSGAVSRVMVNMSGLQRDGFP